MAQSLMPADFEENYPITAKIQALMERCAKDDVPADVFMEILDIHSLVLQSESDARFNKVEKRILRIFKKR